MDINWTSLLTGVAGGIIPAAVAYYMGKRNVEASLQVNRDKIEADRESLKLQLAQKEKELAAQFKMETEKLHSEDRKRVCWEFLAAVNPGTFSRNTFDFDKMAFATAQLYMYCDDDTFSYFENLVRIINKRELWNFGVLYKKFSEEVINKQAMLREVKDTRAVGSQYDATIEELLKKEIQDSIDAERKLTEVLSDYSAQYEAALKATKKMIMGEPLGKAEPVSGL